MFSKLLNVRTMAIVTVIGTSMLTGCASIVNGTSQVVSVDARNKNEPVVGATCQLNNTKGVYYVTTPGTVTVSRAYGDMDVKCEKVDLPPGIAAVKSAVKGMAFGNIFFGGVIGAAIDAGSGAAYDYPNLISVIMGESISLPASAPVAGSSTPTTVPSVPIANPVAQK
jgi:hypothetical protein